MNFAIANKGEEREEKREKRRECGSYSSASSRGAVMPAVSGKAARNRSQGGDGSLDESRDDAGKTSTSQNRSREEIEEEEEDECPPSPVEESSEGTGDGAMQTRIDILPSRLTVGASTSSAPRNDIRKKSNPHAQRRSFYEEDVNYALVFVPEFCHAPDMLCVRHLASSRTTEFLIHTSHVLMCVLMSGESVLTRFVFISLTHSLIHARFLLHVCVSRMNLCSSYVLLHFTFARVPSSLCTIR